MKNFTHKTALAIFGAALLASCSSGDDAPASDSAAMESAAAPESASAATDSADADSSAAPATDSSATDDSQGRDPGAGGPG